MVIETGLSCISLEGSVQTLLGCTKSSRERKLLLQNIHIHTCATSVIVMLRTLPRGAKITANVDYLKCSPALFIRGMISDFFIFFSI